MQQIQSYLWFQHIVNLSHIFVYTYICLGLYLLRGRANKETIYPGICHPRTLLLIERALSARSRGCDMTQSTLIAATAKVNSFLAVINLGFRK